MDPDSKKIIVSRDMVFDEVSIYYSLASSRSNINNLEAFPSEIDSTEGCQDDFLPLENI